ncbi:MAG: 3'-5' exonuclease [Clostridiales bacterium]|nr:3'-5' exonuclease [Clostridiales bacterium]
MNEIYKKINELSGNKYVDCRFPDVKFGDGIAVVTVYYDGERFDPTGKASELSTLLEKICRLNGSIRLVLEKCEQTENSVVDAVKRFTQKFPFVAGAAERVKATSPTCVVIPMHEGMKALASDDYIPRLTEYLKNRFVHPIEIKIEAVELNAFDPEPEPKQERKTYAIEHAEPVIGDLSGGEALSAACVDGNYEGITVCGVLTMATDMISKGTGASRQKRYEKFLLYDGEHTQQCRYFPNDKTAVSDCNLLNTPVVVFGNSLLERGRTGEATLTVKAISKIVSGGPSAVNPIDPPSEYKTVFPKPYEEYVQASLFSIDEKTPDNLKGTFVAFDFETTGLSIHQDSPTELGAVKIVDGEITEVFHTLIDPKRPIPDVVVQKTGITDEMVKGQPTFEDVLPDFYKFSYGAALVGHNISFDFPFLIKFGNRIGYCFGDRRTFDTLGMAPRALPGIDVLTLDSVLGRLNLVNDNAHRALSDATATAKAFIAMCKLLSK